MTLEFWTKINEWKSAHQQFQNSAFYVIEFNEIDEKINEINDYINGENFKKLSPIR